MLTRSEAPLHGALAAGLALSAGLAAGLVCGAAMSCVNASRVGGEVVEACTGRPCLSCPSGAIRPAARASLCEAEHRQADLHLVCALLLARRHGGLLAISWQDKGGG